jgi:hypothetical protein
MHVKHEEDPSTRLEYNPELWLKAGETVEPNKN